MTHTGMLPASSVFTAGSRGGGEGKGGIHRGGRRGGGDTEGEKGRERHRGGEGKGETQRGRREGREMKEGSKREREGEIENHICATFVNETLACIDNKRRHNLW